jgi:hypothetical protein
MAPNYVSGEDAEFFNLQLAKWVIGMLGVLIRVVGKESLLGLMLRQTRSEIASLVRDEEEPLPAKEDSYKYN